MSLAGDIGAHVSAVMLEGDTMEHISHGNGYNVPGPGGTANPAFSYNALITQELLDWHDRQQSIPEPTSATLPLPGLV